MQKTLFFIASLLTLQAYAQKDVCPGDPPTWCFVEGLPNSTYEWWAEGAEVLEDDNNRVLLRWHAPGTYEVSVQETSADGCEGEIRSTTIVVKNRGEGDCAPELTVPNIFTPNGDGRNDKFTVTSKYLQVFRLQVFTRWGKRVFDSRDTNKSWDGHINGQLAAEGTYFWTAHYGDGDILFTHKGTVYLKR